MEIVPGVHRVDRVRGGNVHLLVVGALALIDTGLPGNADAVVDYVRNLGRDPVELSHIILTHGHIDHAGSAAALRRLTGAKVVAHRDEVTLLPDGMCVLQGDLPGRRGAMVRLLSRLGRFDPCPVDVVVHDGDLLPCAGGTRVIHAPGHTPGSISLLVQARGALFVGDAIISNRDRLSRPLPFGSDTSQSEHSLAKLAQLSFITCCFGHGHPLTSGAMEAVRSFAANPPGSPLWQRIAGGRRDLTRFILRLWAKRNEDR